MMHHEIDVTCYAGYRGNERPVKFTFQNNEFHIKKILDRSVRESPTNRERVYRFKDIDSTNREAKRLIEEGKITPRSLIIAESQLKGYGRFERSWFSPVGGLYFTLVLRRDFSPEGLPLFVGICVAEGFRRTTGIEILLKWPNDLLIGGKKAGGILTEAAGRPRMRYAVVGVGVNANTPAQGLPRALRSTATSVAAAAGHRVARAPLLRRILEEMDRRYSRLLAEDDREWLADEWRSMTPMTGRIVRVRHLSRETEGTVAGVDPDGALLLRTPAGTVTRILAGDISYLRDDSD